MTERQPTVEDIARTICRAYCRLHKRPEWDMLTASEQDAEVEHQWDLWVVEARAVHALYGLGERASDSEERK